MTPQISIIIPCFNQAVFLEEAVNSVKDQTFTAWECIIVNDASTDDTISIASRLAAEDNRVKLVHAESNLGLPGARNLGIANATGKYILPLDADDKIGKSYIGEAINVFKQSPETKLVYAKAAFFGEQSGEWDLPPYHYALLFARNPIYCSAIFSKEDWALSGGYDETLRHGLEDWDFWLKILTPASKVVRLAQVGFWYRKHAKSMIGDLLETNGLFEKERENLLLRHQQQWFSWSSNHLYPLLEQMQFYREREQKLAKNWLGRSLNQMARWVSNT